jgi:hypothetical protein
VLITGLARLVTRRLAPSHPLFPPTLAALALLLTLPLLYAQGFLRLGEKTPTSVALALATASLPLAALWGLVLRRRRRSVGAVARLDDLALLCVLQWALVLAAWGLLPLRLWASAGGAVAAAPKTSAGGGTSPAEKAAPTPTSR